MVEGWLAASGADWYEHFEADLEMITKGNINKGVLLGIASRFLEVQRLVASGAEMRFIDAFADAAFLENVEELRRLFQELGSVGAGSTG